MKIFRALFFLTLFSCKIRDSKNLFVGNWSFCDQRGRYNEIHVSNKTFDHHWTAIPSGIPFVYEITNDTLLCFNPGSDDSTWYKFRLTFISNDHLRLNDAENAFELFRITRPIKTSFQLDSIKENGEKQWILKEDFLDRLSKANCKDPRSPTEKLRDSIATKHFLDSIASKRFLDSVATKDSLDSVEPSK